MKLCIEIESGADGLYSMHCIDENEEALCEDTERTAEGIAATVREILSVKEAQASIAMMCDALTEDICTTVYEFSLYGVLESAYELRELDGRELTLYTQEIRDALGKRQDNMEEYFDEEPKLLSAVWDVQEIQQELKGVCTVQTKDPLTDAEIEKIGTWISGQNTDGFGEVFAQYSIPTNDDAELFVTMEEDIQLIAKNRSERRKK